MNRRSPFLRFLTLAWASLQLAAPALSSIADGRLSMDSASKPTTHVEATTSASCPVVHSPDCAVCRYLSTSSSGDATPPTLLWVSSARCAVKPLSEIAAKGVAVSLQRSRAPPAI